MYEDLTPNIARPRDRKEQPRTMGHTQLRSRRTFALVRDMFRVALDNDVRTRTFHLCELKIIRF